MFKWFWTIFSLGARDISRLNRNKKQEIESDKQITELFEL